MPAPSMPVPASASSASTPAPEPPAVVFEHVALAFDDDVVLKDVSFTVPKGSMRMLLGASGAGKSLVLKMMLGLVRPDSGRVYVNGVRIDDMPEQELLRVRGDIGISFQETALFDSLSVAENVGYRLQEMAMSADETRRRVEDVAGSLGLGEYLERLPSELSGGPRRRVALARAMAGKPGLLLLDDPTTGLDPVIAATVDDEIVRLRDVQRVTAVLATHQIRDAYYVATHRSAADGTVTEVADGASGLELADFMVLHEGRIYFEGTGASLLADPDPFLKEFLFMTLPPW